MFDRCSPPSFPFPMNFLIWNCRGAQKPSFQNYIHELSRKYDPAIFAIMETKFGGNKAKEITAGLPFDGAIHTETIGLSGGLWLLWNDDKVSVEELAKTEQEIHTEVKVCASNLSWIFSTIYASPKNEDRCVLWNNLNKVAELHNKPWVMVGDFNEPLLDEDKFGGRGVSVNRSLAFKDCLDSCNMVDMGFAGSKYTWTNKRDISNLILERIDRYFMNPAWCVLYPDAKVTHLPRCHSDHYPVLMEAFPASSLVTNKPFRFQEFWLSDLTFPNIVLKAWSSDRSLADAIDTFSKEATLWNRSHFGNIHHRKKRVLARIYGVQKALSIFPNTFLINLENQLQLELENILDQERDLRMLKSRINWMIQGDRNTSFYHVFALARRKRNHIASVMDERGQWITDGGKVREHFRKGFVSLYTTSFVEVERVPSFSVQWQVQLSEEERCSLDVTVTLEEIKEALWAMKPYKSPGPDGLHAGFYQRFWLTMGDSVVKEVMKVFLDRKVPDYLNKTLIVLIPKVQGPKSIGNYRPISLCNSVYKIISKIIVNQLRPLLENIVLPFQSAFISGRRGMDNIIIVQELIHTIGRAKGKKGYMAIKIDLEKAYDRTEWSFIREMLLKFNFPIKLTDLIMSYVSSVLTSLLINGSCLDSFCPSRGIRQGDPLPPYLFILCMEYLGHLIEEKCAAKVWNPMKASRNGPSFSHLFFADDLVLFAEADTENCLAINEDLQEFCAKSS